MAAAEGTLGGGAAAAVLSSLFPSGVATALLAGQLPVHPLLEAELRAVEQAGEQRRAEFAAGRSCARSALATLGVGACAIEMNADRSPRWPHGFAGSIAHTRGCAAAAVAPVSRVRALGLDLERCVQFDARLVADICTPDEREWLDTLVPAARGDAATLLFSAKEAFYKCQYALTQRWLEFQQVSIEVAGAQLHVARAPDDLLALPWHGRHGLADGIVYAGFSLACAA